jgi:curved DNA-binding protein CbpA
VNDIQWRDVSKEPDIEWLEYRTIHDYYETLEVSPNASPEVIKRAYRTLLERYHPDKHPDTRKAWAEEMTKQLNEAFSVLGDDARRKEYDDRRRSQRQV